MMSLRYFNAFLLSTLTFLLLYFSLLSLTKTDKVLKPKTSKVIKVAIITPPKKIIQPIIEALPTPIIPPIPKPQVKKVEEKKVLPIIKPKPKPKKIKKKIVKKKIVKKVIKKKVIKKVQPKIIKKKTIETPVQEAPVETYIPIAPPVYVAPKPIPKAMPQPIPTAQQSVKSDVHRKAFLRDVRSNIFANKKYPKIAKRRQIEGSVKVRFDITKSGHVSNIRFINGKSIFHKSIRKTLERTFPMGIPNEVKNDLPIIDVSIVLHFNLR
ncbi:MAG: Histone H1-like protein HC2 [uncultured Sulfurovum sp.]|uniref:Histone H1-like protein HC2 n=1 Tax=uncultured Sulfurovum sp. TaxID=269237 RepID=A0A6S6TNI6_9BACT|nr:MAG: Histone H1-like protein HC2 [uncultured Sulfurovum sp.]